MIVSSRIKPTSSGGESLVFDINLALFTLTCVAIVPDEGTDEAPVYVHFKLKRGKPMHNGNGKRMRMRRPESEIRDDAGNR
jgi:hypothetical protein